MSSARVKKCFMAMLAAQLGLAAACNQANSGDSDKTDASKSQTSSTAPQPAVTPLPIGGYLLVEADLLPTPNYTIKSKTPQELDALLSQWRGFYSNQPETSLPIPPGFEGCYKELDAFAMEANKVSAKMVKTLDVSKCVALATESGVVIKSLKATVSIYLYISCSKGDVSGLHGKPFREMSTKLIGKSGCEEGSMHLEFLSDTDSEASWSGVPAVFKRRTVSLDGTRELAGCHFTVKNNVESRADDCINFVKDDYFFDTTFMGQSMRSAFSDMYRFDFLKVASDLGSDNNIWRNQGQVKLSVNNWLGTLSFNGSNNAPTYEARDEKAATSTSGQLTATPAGPDIFVPSALKIGF